MVTILIIAAILLIVIAITIYIYNLLEPVEPYTEEQLDKLQWLQDNAIISKDRELRAKPLYPY